MSYLKINISDNSIKALKPNNRLQGDLPKKRLNITIDPEIYYHLKANGNVSGTIENLAKDFLSSSGCNNSEIVDKLRVIIKKIDGKETGYKSNSSGKLIKDLKDILQTVE